MPQSISTSRAIGIIRLIFKSLSLMVVQRHNAASKSSSPCSTGQQASFALLPIPMCTRPPNTSTHAPSLRVSMGQVCDGGGGYGLTFGGGGGGHGVPLGGGGGLGLGVYGGDGTYGGVGLGV